MTTPVAKKWYKMLFLMCIRFLFFLQIVCEHFECIDYHSQILSVDWSHDWSHEILVSYFVVHRHT